MALGSTPVQTGTTTVAAASDTVTLGAAPTDGNTVFAFIKASVSHTLHGISSAGSWVKVGGVNTSGPGLSLWRLLASSTPAAVTMTATGATSMHCTVSEWAGVRKVSPDNQFQGTIPGGTGNSLDLTDITTTVYPDQLVLAVVGLDNNSGGSPAADGGFTVQANNTQQLTYYKVLSALSTVGPTLSWATIRTRVGYVASFFGDNLRVDGTSSTETDTATAGTPKLTPAGSLASESDTAFAGTPTIRPAGTLATETDTAFGGTPAVSVPGSAATETDTPFAGTAQIVGGGTQATETDTAFSGTPTVVLAGSGATESDTAFGGSPALVVTGSLATETDTAFGGAPTLVVVGSLADELDTAFAGVAVGGITRNRVWDLGWPGAKWHADGPEPGWEAGALASKWSAGPPQE